MATKANVGDLVVILKASLWKRRIPDCKSEMVGNIYAVEKVLAQDEDPEKDYTYEISIGFSYRINKNFFKEEDIELVYTKA